jgi:hypothetical protein
MINLNYANYSDLEIIVDFEKVRNNRLIKNSLVKLVVFRNGYIKRIENQEERAESLLSIIDSYLAESK